MINYILISATLIFAAISLKREGLLSTHFFITINSAASSIVLLWVTSSGFNKLDFVVNNVYFTAMPMWNIEEHNTTTISFLTIISALAVTSTFHYKPHNRYPHRPTTLHATKNINNYFKYFLLIFIYCISILHFTELDKSALWFNTSYQTIKTPESIGISTDISKIYHHLLRVVGLIAGILFAVSLCNRSYLISFLLFGILAYAFTLMYAGNSRWVLIYGASISISFLYFSKSLVHKQLALAFALLAIVSYFQVLFGRSSSTFGISTISQNLLSFNDLSFRSALNGFIVNTFESGLNISNSLLLNPDFTPRYQIGSLSPLISSIDGFSEIRALDEKRITINVPMSAYGEVLHFSTFGKFVFFTALVLSLNRISVWNRKTSGVVKLCVSIFFIYVFYLLGTYSLRTTFRFIFIVASIDIISNSLYFLSSTNRQVSSSTTRENKI